MPPKEETQEHELCVVCAWRQDCVKKYSLAYGQKCLEFTRDLTLKAKRVGEAPPEHKKEK